MGAKKTVQKAGQHEIALGDIGGKKYDAAAKFDPAQKYMSKTALKDRTELHRGRANAQVAQGFAKPLKVSYAMAASGKGLNNLNKVNTLNKKGMSSGLSEGKKRGVMARDNNIYSAVNIGLGEGQVSGRSMGELAKQEYQNASLAGKLATQRANDMRGAGMALGSAVAGSYANSVNRKLDKGIESAWDGMDDKMKASFGNDIGQFANSGNHGFKATGMQRLIGSLGGTQVGYGGSWLDSMWD